MRIGLTGFKSYFEHCCYLNLFADGAFCTMVIFGCTFYFVARGWLAQDSDDSYQNRMERQYPKHVPGNLQPKGLILSNAIQQNLLREY